MTEWRPANNGEGKFIYFLVKDDDSLPVDERLHFNAQGRVVRYKSMESAQKAADKLNADEDNVNG
jgi:hypothetical protein